MTWRHADALQLPFPDDSFDVVVCQFGVMFFPDKPDGARRGSSACSDPAAPSFSTPGIKHRGPGVLPT